MPGANARTKKYRFPKAYRVPKPKRAYVPSGAELGEMARHCLVKSAASILELAQIVSQAYKTYYLAGAKTLKAKRGRPVSQKRALNRGTAQAHWEYFLAESGYQMPKHHKLLRTLARIGEQAAVLQKKSANLPNSIEAVGVITSPAVRKAGALQQLLERMTPECTAKDAKKIRSEFIPESARVQHSKH